MKWTGSRKRFVRRIWRVAVLPQPLPSRSVPVNSIIPPARLWRDPSPRSRSANLSSSGGTEVRVRITKILFFFCLYTTCCHIYVGLNKCFLLHMFIFIFKCGVESHINRGLQMFSLCMLEKYQYLKMETCN